MLVSGHAIDNTPLPSMEIALDNPYAAIEAYRATNPQAAYAATPGLSWESNHARAIRLCGLPDVEVVAAGDFTAGPQKTRHRVPDPLKGSFNPPRPIPHPPGDPTEPNTPVAISPDAERKTGTEGT